MSVDQAIRLRVDVNRRDCTNTPVSPVLWSFFFVEGEGGDHLYSGFGETNCGYLPKIHRPMIAPGASPATRDTRLLLLCSNLYPYPPLRDKFWRVTIGLLLFSTLYPYTRTSLSMTSTWFHIWRTFHFFRVVLWLCVHVASFLFMGRDDFSHQIMLDPLFLAVAFTASLNYSLG